ncbi:thioesterase family protein [Nostocoides vanveenii]|uniref:Thioesterase family protein n=1 Tax=Nostocoides vanveenii TaxID=330835 RepID=A0ABN2L4M6_9MICO
MTAPEAYYLPLGEGRFESTTATQSPWDFAAQHGGPPSALCVREIERHHDDPTMRVARFTADFLAPIPQGVCRVTTRTVRPGRRVALVEAELTFGERAAVVMRAWLIHREDDRAEPADWAPPARGLPGPQEQRYFPGMDPAWGYGRSIEWRWASGAFDIEGPAAVWARPHTAIVAGEAPTHTQLVAAVADSTNGISAPLHLDGWLFIPPSITVTCLRPAEGEWIYLDAATHVAADGIGVAHATISDARGFVAYATQPVLIDRR